LWTRCGTPMALSTADGDGWFAFGRITLAQKKRSRRWSPLTVHVRLFAQRGRATAPSAKPAAANAKDEKAPVSVSGMTAPEYAQCVSEAIETVARVAQTVEVGFERAADVGVKRRHRLCHAGGRLLDLRRRCSRGYESATLYIGSRPRSYIRQFGSISGSRVRRSRARRPGMRSK
jgi:hypothetical protein